MSYCRNCGAKLDKDARFCRNCGTPVQGTQSDYHAPLQRVERKPFRLPTAILIGILLVATLSAITLVPFIPVNSTQSHTISQVNVNTINLDFDADITDVNVFIRDLPDQLMAVDVITQGSVGIFASNPPIMFSLSNETIGQNMTIIGRVSRQDIWPMSLNLNVVCNIYMDYSATVNLNVRTSVGDITMNEIAEPIHFQSLNLRTATGNVKANLTNLVTIDQDISIETTTGNLQFICREINVSSNIAINLRSTTGRMNAQITQNEMLRNVTVNAQATTGDVNFDMKISGAIGAQITSQTTTGRITLDVNRFDGAQSPIHSRNYPAPSNFEVTLGTTTGNIHIVAQHQISSAIDQQGTTDINEIYI